MLTYVPFAGRFDGPMIEGFRQDHSEFDGRGLTYRSVRAQHDRIYYVTVSAISAMAIWAIMSATQNSALNITASGAKVWADSIVWRGKQARPPLEPPPPKIKGAAAVLPGQLELFE